MVRDLELPIEIVGPPTVREADGLALSSRNAYLSAEERKIAPTLNRVLREVAGRVANGEAQAPAVAEARRVLLEAGYRKVDYVEVRESARFCPSILCRATWGACWPQPGWAERVS